MRVSNFTSTDVLVGNSSSSQVETPSPVTSETEFLSEAFQSPSSVLKDIYNGTIEPKVESSSATGSTTTTTNGTISFFKGNTTKRIKPTRTLSKHQQFQTFRADIYNRKHFPRKQKQHISKVQDDDIKDESQFAAQPNQTGANVTKQVVRYCETNAQCGQSADCVKVNQMKQCWCISELESPDPDTGECGSISHEIQNPDKKNGVFELEHMRGIFHDNINITNRNSANETSSTLHIESRGLASDVSLLQIIPAVCGSFIFISVVLAISIIYRRRHSSKHFCVIRNGDIIARNNDGTLLLDRMNNITKNPTYFCPNNTNAKRNYVKEVAIEHLKLLEVVGEGAFGQVFRGELYIPECESHKQVAVKVLKDGANREARDDFDREVEIMSSFDHDNILKLLCVIIEGTHGNPYMIFEYMEHGDLSELLRKNDPHFRNCTGKRIILTKTDMVDVSVQIANGMCYLATQRFVHRDLATRNCLVGGGLIVKISDFGMSRDVYTTDYYRIGGSRMLPVRWMSPEAIKYGRFTSESDIWAYGVVLWEIFSFGKQPYYGHTNEEVLHFLDQGILLQRPEDCPSTVYHVMLGCWKKDPKERLIFDRLLKHLTEYRNRLMKSPHTPQQNSNSRTDVLTTLQNSTPGGRLGARDKVDGVTETRDKVDGDIDTICEVHDDVDNGISLNYLTLAGSDRVHSDVNTILIDEKSNIFVSKECLSTNSDILHVNNSLKEALTDSLTADIDAVGVCEKKYEQEHCETQGISVSSNCLTQGTGHGVEPAVSNDLLLSELQKRPSKRQASFPLSNHTGKASQSRSRANKRYGSLKHVPLKQTSELLENNIKNDFSASALELCPRVTSFNQNASMFIHNHNIKSSHHIHTKCGSMNHMTNKVTDKSSFPEQHWNINIQTAGVADGCPAFSCFAETLDLHPAGHQSQREIAVNEYSISGPLPV